MKKLFVLLLACCVIFSLTACGEKTGGTADAKPETQTAEEVREEVTEEVQEEVKEEAPAVTEQDIDAALQGTWDVSGGSFEFDHGNVSVVSSGTVLRGTYSINMESSEIAASIEASNGKVSIKMPFEYKDGELTVYNNRGVALTKRG